MNRSHCENTTPPCLHPAASHLRSQRLVLCISREARGYISVSISEKRQATAAPSLSMVMVHNARSAGFRHLCLSRLHNIHVPPARLFAAACHVPAYNLWMTLRGVYSHSTSALLHRRNAPHVLAPT